MRLIRPETTRIRAIWYFVRCTLKAASVRRNYRSPIGLLFGATLALACGDTRSRPPLPEQQPLQLAAVDTLVEHDTLYVGRPFRATFTESGTLLVIDQFANRVVEFDRSGRVLRTIGRAGRGPGEFLAPVAIERWGRDTIVVADLWSRSVSLFRAGSGDFVSRVAVSGFTVSLASSAAGLALGAYSLENQTAAAWISNTSGNPTALAAFPASAVRNPLALRAYPASFVAVRGESLAVAIPASNELIVQGVHDSIGREVSVPVRMRRPIPQALDEALTPVLPTPERLTFIPYPDGMRWRSDGIILLWHKDWQAPAGGIQGSANTVELEAKLRVYATLIDRAKSRACVDMVVPSDWTENPVIFADDTNLYALGHVVGDSAMRPTLELRRYAIQLDVCVWQSLTPRDSL